jgi:formylglycine-generating enzyme required for sulfatase activity
MHQIQKIQNVFLGKTTCQLICLLFLIQGGCNSKSGSSNSSRDWSESKSAEHIPQKIPQSSSPPDSSTIRFVTIPGGSTKVGSVKSEPGRDSIMERLKMVNVDLIVMSRSEITMAQWYSIMDPTRSISMSEANWPITNITWYEAFQFCQILTIKTGFVHRLPTEAEWEHACKAGSEEMFGTWKGNCSLSEAITRTDYTNGSSCWTLA